MGKKKITKPKAKNTKINATKDKLTKRLILVMWSIFAGIVLGIPLYFFIVSINLFGLFGGMPSLRDLENPENELSSELYSADGQLLGKYFRFDRSQVSYEELSPNLIHALTATEDIRFEEHSGIDLRAVMRVIKGVITLNNAGGGSTLTQQLAKNLFDTRYYELGSLAKMNSLLKKVIAKSKEWLLSIKLEQSFTKKEILAMYLNTVDFGSNSFGIKVASKTFFNTTQDSLKVEEAAMLVGLLKAPTKYSPVRNPDNATKRREVVLSQMKNYDFLSQEQYDSLRQLDLGLNYKVVNHNVGMATYFRSVIRPFLLDWSKKNGHDLFEDGLKIYTTIDSKLQAYAEKAVDEHMRTLQKKFYKHWEGRNPWIDENRREMKNFIPRMKRQSERYRTLVKKYGKGHDSIDIVMNTKIPMRVFSWDGEIDTLMSPVDSIKYYKHFLHAGFLAMDPYSGHLKAWVGGINHKYFKYDHVMQGKRQPGSTFKPIVYTVAMDVGYYPCYKLVDAPITVNTPGSPPWKPKNADNKYSNEKMTIRQAMAQSVNTVTARVSQMVGIENVVKYARKMGITSPLDPVPSLCLGTGDVSLYELIGAYGTFVNEGIWTEPIFITRIEDKYGNVLQQFTPNTRLVLSEEVAYLMLYMLRGTTEERGGTALGLSSKIRHGNEIGGKTGTTSNYSDGWFVGVTKDLVAGAWVGGEERSIHFRTLGTGQGARTAMPIYEKFMLQVYDDPDIPIKKGPFKRPKKKLSIELNCDKYQQDGDNEGVVEATDAGEVDEIR